MNKKQWSGLLLLYLGYLLMGATIFFFIESDVEEERRKDNIKKFTDVAEIVKKLDHREIEKLEEYFGKNFSETDPEIISPTVWDFYNSFFFVVTVVSTIGYGNLSPTLSITRILMIIYAVIGIPLNGILLTSLGQFFSAVFVKAHKRYKNHELYYNARWGLSLEILTYLVPGLIIFIFLPSGVFMYFEKWTFDQAVYYAFVTLTTIGFGDLVAGQKPMTEYHDSVTYLYKILLLFWILFGLGYLIMLLGFVTQGLHSKKIIRLEKKLLTALTHSKLWHNIEKDMGYLRRIVNEINLDKVKPVFRDEEDDSMERHQNLYRSKSLPVIKMEVDSKGKWRQRANSEYFPHKISIARMFSESDLQRIDKQATFAGAKELPSSYQVMKQVLDAFGPGKSVDTSAEGVHVFSDDEVLASERLDLPSVPPYNPTIIYTSPFEHGLKSRRPRVRTLSENPPVGLDPFASSSRLHRKSNAADLTWSGTSANAIQDAINKRYKQRLLSGLERSHKTSISSMKGSLQRLNPLNRKHRNNIEDTELIDSNPDPDSAKREKSKLSFLSVPQIEVKRHSLQEDGLHHTMVSPTQDIHYMTHTAGLKGAHYVKKPPRPERSEERDVLEETSVADFLRVLQNLHATIGERLIAEPQSPRRKMGTASLTPPTLKALLELFPENDTPKPVKRRKGSLIPNFLKRADSKSEHDVEHAANDNHDTEKSGDTSNLKRLGRFLLRSYPNAPKGSDGKQRKFSSWEEESCRQSVVTEITVTPADDDDSVAVTIEPSDFPLNSDSTDSVFFKP